MTEEEYEKAIIELDRLHKEDLKEKSAFDMSCGDNYVAYLKKDNDGYVAEVWSWGVRHEDVREKSISKLKDKIHSMYDG